MLVEFGKSNLLLKVRQQPDKMWQVLDKARTDGLLTTLDAVLNKLDQPLPLGYCNVGTVIAVGDLVQGFKVGDRVASNGPHAELVAVPQLLCALIPDDVSDEAAAFTVLASIGLQGIRLALPTLGETFLVSGLGLIGLLTAQLLKTQGCRVLGVDTDPAKCTLASSLGIEALDLDNHPEPLSWILQHSSGIGVDGVLITAATTSSEPLHLAAQACRQRGRIVLVGVTGLELRRDLFYKKELTFQVSCSYGPGRYDPSYENHGHDYPLGFVRWTQQRNFQAVLQAISSGNLCTEQLVSHRFPFEHAPEAYEILTGTAPSFGILLQYSGVVDTAQRTIQLPPQTIDESFAAVAKPLVSVIGSGNYASRTLLPAFHKAGARFHTLAAPNGLGPSLFGQKHRFIQASTDIAATICDPQVHALVIATRHDSHATLVQKSLAAGKHVFVEKPLCLTTSELDSIESALDQSSSQLMVGFNRRFSPLLKELREQLHCLPGPRAFVYSCNAGAIPPDHWTQDPACGGGRLLGEVCHFVDLLRHLAGCSIEQLQLITASDTKPCPDTLSLNLRFVDGSIGTVHYFSNGSKAFPKERLEVFASGRILRLDNYRKLQAWGIPRFRTRRLLVQDKGQQACCKAFLEAITSGGPAPIPAVELLEVQRWLLLAVNR